MSAPKLYKQFFTMGGGLILASTAASSGGLSLPQTTINVDSTANFPTSGSIYVITLVNSFYSQQLVTYTGKTATSFTGCTGGAGVMQTGYSISLTGTIANSTWTCPAGVKYVIITGCGGGGGGGSGASSSGRSNIYFAGGGSGGHPAITCTQIVSVTPGVVYNISIGLGGVGGPPNCVANQVQGGGTKSGEYGFDGASSIFGSVVLPGGRGGRAGSLISASSLTFVTGSDCNGTLIAGSSPSIWNIQKMADVAPMTKAGAVQGAAHSVNRSGSQHSLSGGGTAGGTSNNVYSAGGNGGAGAQGFDGYPFSSQGGHATYGGGGGGGGGGENWDYNNTGSGAFGGWGGSGFIEVSWVA